MTEQTIGDNARAQLQSVLDRVLKLHEQKDEIGKDISEVYAEAKSNGYDVAALRVIVRQERQDAEKRKSLEDSVDLYRSTLGMLG